MAKSAPSIIRNSAWKASASLVGIMLLMLTTPAFLRALGEDKFGLYMLLIAVIAPFEILNAGVSQASVKYLAAWLPQGLLKESRDMVQVNLLFNVVVGAVAVLGLWFASPWLVSSVFKINEDLRADAILSFRLTAPVWLAVQISAAYSAHAAARQNFQAISIVQIFRLTLLYPGGLLMAITFGTVASIQLWSLFTTLLVLIFWGFSLTRELGAAALLPSFNKVAFHKSFGFSVWQMLNSICGAVSQQADRVLLGALLGTAAVAVYGIAISVQQKAVQLVWSALGSLFPAISEHADSNPGEAERIFRVTGSHLAFLGCLCYGMGALFATEFCVLWLGEGETARQAGYLLSIAFIVAILGTPSAQFTQFILGHGLTRLNFLGNLAFAIIAALATWKCIEVWGVEGALWGIVAAVIIARPPLHWWIARFYMCNGQSTIKRLASIYSSAVFVLIAIASTLLIKNPAANPILFTIDVTTNWILAAFLFIFVAMALNLAFYQRDATAYSFVKFLACRIQK